MGIGVNVPSLAMQPNCTSALPPGDDESRMNDEKPLASLMVNVAPLSEYETFSDLSADAGQLDLVMVTETTEPVAENVPPSMSSVNDVPDPHSTWNENWSPSKVMPFAHVVPSPASTHVPCSASAGVAAPPPHPISARASRATHVFDMPGSVA